MSYDDMSVVLKMTSAQYELSQMTSAQVADLRDAEIYEPSLPVHTAKSNQHTPSKKKKKGTTRQRKCLTMPATQTEGHNTHFIHAETHTSEFTPHALSIIDDLELSEVL